MWLLALPSIQTILESTNQCRFIKSLEVNMRWKQPIAISHLLVLFKFERSNGCYDVHFAAWQISIVYHWVFGPNMENIDSKFYSLWFFSLLLAEITLLSFRVASWKKQINERFHCCTFTPYSLTTIKISTHSYFHISVVFSFQYQFFILQLNRVNRCCLSDKVNIYRRIEFTQRANIQLGWAFSIFIFVNGICIHL